MKKNVSVFLVFLLAKNGKLCHLMENNAVFRITLDMIDGVDKILG
jgi:hypothetical protein